MKWKKKAIWQYVFLIFLCLIGTAACQKREKDDRSNYTDIPPVGNIETTPAITFKPSEMKTVVYYTLSDSMEKEEVTALLPEDTELTPEYLVGYVTQAMESAVVVEVDSVEIAGKSVIVSFTENTAPVCNTDADLENNILDAIAQSILENFSEYTNVIYRVMGGAYESQNYRFKLNQVYLGN